MPDFRKIVSPRIQKQLRNENAEVARLHALDDSALAAEILDLARQAREIRADKVEVPFYTYTTALLHQVIPFLAKKMDPSIELEQVEIDAIESAKPDRLNNMAAKELGELRSYVGVMISNASMVYGLTAEQSHEMPIRILDRLLEHGNPVALLVDRLAPAPEGLDRVERPGDGTTRFPAWTPPDARAPLEGFWLMVTRPDGHENVAGYYDTRAQAAGALANAAEKGLPQDHHLFSRWSYEKLEPSTIVSFDLRDWDNESVSDVLEGPLKREEPEAEVSVLEP